MKITTIPSGDAGWNERVLLVREIIASRPEPPFRYDDVLYLVPSARQKRTYGRLFLSVTEEIHGSRALVPPAVVTLHQFLQGLSAKAGGPPLIDETSRLILLEGLVKELMHDDPDLGGRPDVLAPSLSAAIAGMIEELRSAGVAAERLASAVNAADFADRPAARLLVRAYGAYERTLRDKNMLDPGGMLALIAERFDASWLGSWKRIIIDGIHAADGMQARVVAKLAEHENCSILLEAPSPDSVIRATAHHPLRFIRELLGSIGAPLSNMNGVARSEDVLLSRSLFSEGSFDDAVSGLPDPGAFGRNLRLISAVTPREEVSFIAREVRRSLETGAVPDSILVSFPALDEYGPLVEEIFSDYGIPFNRALGRQLATSPVTTAVMSLLRACREDFSGPSLLRILSTPFLKFGRDPSLGPSLDRLLRERRITGGKPRILDALVRRPPGAAGNDMLRGALTDLFAALEPFLTEETASLAAWIDRLAGLLTWSGAEQAVMTVKGPQNINLQAFQKMKETLDVLSRAGRLFPEYRYTFGEFFFLLRKTFMHSRFQVPPEDESGVQILGLGESTGRAWSEIYFGGLIEGHFPQSLPQNIFLPETTLEALGVRALERARATAAWHFHRILFSATKVTLTWPENRGDRPVAVSPFLMELAPWGKAGLLNRGIDKTSGMQSDFTGEASRSIPEFAKAIALAGTVRGLDALAVAETRGLAGIRSALLRTSGPDRLPRPGKRVFRVTELDEYLACPYDYSIRHVLDLEPLEEVTEDLSPARRGSKIHAILRDFYRRWDGPVTPENRDRARNAIDALAAEAFRGETDTFRNRREKEFFLRVMSERFLDAEVECWSRGFRPAYLELDIASFTLPLPDGTDVILSARIDRIDVDDCGGFIIVDYKTGGYPQPRMDKEQDIFQLPVYAVMAQHQARGGPSLTKALGLAYYDLSGRNKGPARDVVLFDKDARGDHTAAKPRASAKTAAEFEQILSRSMEKAKEAVQGILAGDFLKPPRDADRCRYCPNDALCTKEDV